MHAAITANRDVLVNSAAQNDDIPWEPPTDEELDTLGALRRVREPGGGVTELNGRYFYCGQPMAPWLDKTLTTVAAAGLITLSDPDPAACGVRRATLTEAGHARYEALRA
jgi:hypothetical protein